MQQTKLKLEKERDLGEIITDTFTFIRQNFKSLSQVFISLILPILIISVAAGTYYQYATQEITNENIFLENNNPFATFTDLTNTFIPLLLTSIATLLFYVISYLAILGSIKSYQLNAEIQLDFVKQELKDRFWGMTGLSVASSIMIIISLLLCILPFFYMIVPVIIMFPILVIENKSISDSISRAFELIKENFWPSLGTIIVMFLIIMFASGIFQVPVMIYAIFSTITKLDATNVDPQSLIEIDWIFMVLTAVGNIGSNVLSLVTIISSALIYFNLNEKHHLTGTVQEIDSIGNN